MVHLPAKMVHLPVSARWSTSLSPPARVSTHAQRRARRAADGRLLCPRLWAHSLGHPYFDCTARPTILYSWLLTCSFPLSLKQLTCLSAHSSCRTRPASLPSLRQPRRCMRYNVAKRGGGKVERGAKDARRWREEPRTGRRDKQGSRGKGDTGFARQGRGTGAGDMRCAGGAAVPPRSDQMRARDVWSDCRSWRPHTALSQQ